MNPLTPNEIARRLESGEDIIGPKFTLTLEPQAFERNPKYVNWLMGGLRVLIAMLESYFAMQGLTSVTLKWENLQAVRKPEIKIE